MPATAAPEMVLSTALAASLMVSVAVFCRRALVLKRRGSGAARSERRMDWRYMMIVSVVCWFGSGLSV